MEIVFTLLGLLCRVIGLAEWFKSCDGARQARKQAQNVANTPTTDAEWNDDAKAGDL